MIGTLFAQEFRATRKNLVVTTGLLLLIAAVSLAFFALRIPVLGSLGTVLGIVSITLITPMVLGLLVENYWRTMYGREGYLTMSLPVHGRTLFVAKVLYGLVIGAVALAVTGIGLLGGAMAFALGQGYEPLEFLRDGLQLVQPWQVWLGGLAIALQLVFLVVVGAAVMSIGAQARFNHLGFGAPVIGAVIVYIVMQLVTFAAIMFVPLGLVLTGPDAGTLVAQGMFDDVMAAIVSSGGTAAGETPQVLGLGFTVTSVAVIIVMAWWGARSVDRRTSLR